MEPIESLYALRDEGNAAFQEKLIPTVSGKRFLGVRVPQLRALERELRNTPQAEAFLRKLPHTAFDEDLLHAVIISNLSSYGETLGALNDFLPYVDNWSVCDTLRPKAFTKNKTALIGLIPQWIGSQETYTCRFGVEMLMTYFLDADFRPEYLEWPARIRSDEYYVNMMIAWFFATALAKQWNDTVKYVERPELPDRVRNMTIQKACESRRIPEERKDYLRTFRINTKTKAGTVR